MKLFDKIKKLFQKQPGAVADTEPAKQEQIKPEPKPYVYKPKETKHLTSGGSNITRSPKDKKVRKRRILNRMQKRSRRINRLHKSYI